jgi:hypothetical protein
MNYYGENIHRLIMEWSIKSLWISPIYL